jgi:hypothetical protein
MEKKNKRIEEMDDEGWISVVAFFVDARPLEYSSQRAIKQR